MNIEIIKVEKDSDIRKKLLDFVENFSWLEVKEHTIKMVKEWEFQEWESPFVAIVDNKIVGMATIMKTDYYPLPEIYPWISTIFVSEEYRGNRISGKLIDYINIYALELGFNKTYIPSEHIGLYEKYGYSYLKDIVNYGNSIDHLYVKNL
ncbi:MAG: GNAT family N-acetyltransferase [Bacilli bacterium]|nr:GNAT family N-acetyltransferase [Bacilli bacterium]